MEFSQSCLQARHLEVFRKFDVSGDGSISHSELGAALEKVTGLVLPEGLLGKFAASLDIDGNGEINFSEFEALARQLTEPAEKNLKKNKVPRMYLAPQQYSSYSLAFQQTSGDDGKVSLDELQELFTRCNMQVTPERLRQIMAEVDEDGNGSLDQVEFMTLIIKAAGLKKRRLGPGICSLSVLQEEGWSLPEMRKAGYDYKDFTELGFTIEELMEVFTAFEMRKAGLMLNNLLEVGWDCAKAREAGFELAELAAAGCSPQKIRVAGWDDTTSATQLRRLGFKARDMRLGGWSLSELRFAGYSVADLRLAGFSPASLAALSQHQDDPQPSAPSRAS